MKTLGYKIYFFFLMLATFILFPLFLLFKAILPRKLYYRMVQFVVRCWARLTLLATGSTVEVSGKEKLPETRNICFISNHQGMFDIPMVLGFIGIPTGFIAKQELFKIPALSHWMREIPCVFIDRGSARKAIETFHKSAEVIKAGHPMVIFPEGTRSKSDKMGEFHLGSFKLPAMAGATIVPITIKGSWRIYEIDKRIHAQKLKLQILDPITPDSEIYNDNRQLAKHLHQLLSQTLDTM